LQHGFGDIQGLVLLSEGADLQTMARFDLSGVGFIHSGEHAQQRGLAGTVESDDHYLAATVNS
jgi:hypothetical protein